MAVGPKNCFREGFLEEEEEREEEKQGGGGGGEEELDSCSLAAALLDAQATRRLQTLVPSAPILPSGACRGAQERLCQGRTAGAELLPPPPPAVAPSPAAVNCDYFYSGGDLGLQSHVG